MSKQVTSKRRLSDGDIRSEYDFSEGVRGKYAERARTGSNLVLLDPEIAVAFPDSESVNRALRGLLMLAREAKIGKRSRS